MLILFFACDWQRAKLEELDNQGTLMPGSSIYQGTLETGSSIWSDSGCNSSITTDSVSEVDFLDMHQDFKVNNYIVFLATHNFNM